MATRKSTQKQNTQTVTTIEDLKEYKKGAMVRLPDFGEGQPFYARLKRPSLLGMIRQGTIPNTLLVKANELFIQDGSGFDPDEQDGLKQMFDVLDLIAEQTFVEPTYQELKDNEIELTDEQMMFIFNYTQKGVQDLESFRPE